MTDRDPIFDVAQLSHVELFTPKMDESLWFFKDLLGLQETSRDGKSVYLRAYEEAYHHSLKLTERDQPGLAQMGWRAASKSALDRRVAHIEQLGAGIGWVDSEAGYGPAYEYRTPDGHIQRLFWEVERAVIPEALKTPLINRPQKRPLSGVPVRRLDHVNLLCSDVGPMRNFYQEAMGTRLRETIIAGGGEVEVAAWMSHNNLVHDVAMMRDESGVKGRLHHVAFWYGYPQHLADAADVFREHNIKIEAGPGKHGITQAAFLYCFEPGGNRVELFGDAGYLIFEPDWKPVVWEEKDLEAGIIWHGSQLPQEFFLVGTPPAPNPE